MKKLILAAVGTLATGLATAEIVTISRAYEVPLNLMTVPVTLNGSITYRECEDCETNSSLLTQSTLLRVNGQRVDLKEFRKQVFSVHDRSSETVTVLRHLDSNTIESISVRL